jgi:hypothetical protein
MGINNAIFSGSHGCVEGLTGLFGIRISHFGSCSLELHAIVNLVLQTPFE